MLRPARTTELAQVDALIKRFPMQLLDRGVDHLARISDDPDARLMVWDDGTTFRGFIAIEPIYPQVYYLTNLAVSTLGQGDSHALIRAAFACAFTDLAAHRLCLDVVHDNPAALRAFEKAGAQREGVMRQCWKRPDGKWADCVAMAVLAQEWQVLQGT